LLPHRAAVFNYINCLFLHTAYAFKWWLLNKLERTKKVKIKGDSDRETRSDGSKNILYINGFNSKYNKTNENYSRLVKATRWQQQSVKKFCTLQLANFWFVPSVYATMFLGGLGITAGVHRLWSHKAYKAKLPLRIFLMLCQSLAFQNSIWEWTRDHRVHHKFTDTHADPHNSRRGFFFAHMGWLMCKKHPDVTSKGKQISMEDIEQDPVVMFQKK